MTTTPPSTTTPAPPVPPDVDPHNVTISGYALDRAYGPETVRTTDERDPTRPDPRIGEPGQFPFTRGVHPGMYRKRLWTLRQFAGIGSADDTHRRFKYLLENAKGTKATTGLSTAFDLPTLMGRDSDDPLSAGTESKARRQLFSVRGPADACLEGDRIVIRGEAVLEASRMALAGRHNLANAMAAALAATSLGASVESVADVLSTFGGLAPRHQSVLTRAGVTWIDDSKATNVGATLAALEGYPEGSVHLILGGQGKGQDFSPLHREVARAASRLYLIGEDAASIGEALAGTAEVEYCGTLDEAVRRSCAAAVSGEWVLLAPACASFDQFSSYAERGERFSELVRQGGPTCL